jgi:hypothetical protein
MIAMRKTNLLVRKLSAALGALERVLLAALVLEVAVQVVVPVVGALAVRTHVNALRPVRVGAGGRVLLALALLLAALWGQFDEFVSDVIYGQNSCRVKCTFITMGLYGYLYSDIMYVGKTTGFINMCYLNIYM